MPRKIMADWTKVFIAWFEQMVNADNQRVQAIIERCKEIHGGQRAETQVAPVTTAI